MLLLPVVSDAREALPKAQLNPPVVVATIELQPMAVLLAPVVEAPSAPKPNPEFAAS
jgi:hypothetical protein